MSKFKKRYNLVRLFLTLLVLILLSGTTYSYAIPQDCLRLPIGQKTTFTRIETVFFEGSLKNKAVVLKNNEFLLARTIKFSSLTSEDKKKFAEALLKMSQRVVDHKLILISYYEFILMNENLGFTDIYAAIDETDKGWDILALQIVNFQNLEKKEATLATWIKSDKKLGFIANQILAFAISDLLNNGIERVDSSKVRYTKRVREYLPSGINDISVMKKFLEMNTIGVLHALNAIGKDLRSLQKSL